VVVEGDDEIGCQSIARRKQHQSRLQDQLGKLNMSPRSGPCGAAVTAAAHYFPANVVPNSHFASYLETSHEWIVSRTGIKERRFLEKGPTSDMAVEAARRALAQRGMTPSDVDLIVVATATPDTVFPSTACIVQDKLHAKRAWGFDLSAACSGFLYALSTVAAMVRSGVVRNALLIGADKMSSVLDMQDRTTCVVFGDGAGAFVLEATNDDNVGVLDEWHRSDGAGGAFLSIPGGGSAQPASIESVQRGAHFVRQVGPSVFKAAVHGMVDACKAVLARNNLSTSDIAFVAPHQANERLIQTAMERLGLPMERVMLNIDRYGNTNAATIPTVVSEYYERGKLRRGDNLLLTAFGGGFTWGAIWLKWSLDAPT